MARIVGVDFGAKRVGLALADPLRMFAQPYGVFSQEEAVARLRHLKESSGLELVVMGWPLTEEGEEGVATSRVEEYIRRLRRALPGTRFVKWDERYTSVEAKDRLRGVGRVDKGRIDTAAAGIILQEYLDAQSEG